MYYYVNTSNSNFLPRTLGHFFGDLLYLQSAGYFYMIIPDIVKCVVGARVVNILFVCYRLKIKYRYNQHLYNN